MTITLNPTVRQHETATALRPAYVRLGGWAALSGAIIMLIGAALYFSSGTDLWATLDGGDMAAYLTAIGGAKAQLVAGFSFWIVGVLLMGTAVNAVVHLCEQRPMLAQVANTGVATAVPLAIASFILMLSLAVQVAPDSSSMSVAIAQVVGWVGARADDLATALIIGLAPFCLTLAARGEWMPTWLVRWGYVAGGVGLFSLVVLYLPGLGQLGFLIVPVGIGWMIALGVVLLRQRR